MIKLYHGTTITSAKDIYNNSIDVNKGSKHVDFGPGFYTTNDITRAKLWAYRKGNLRKELPALVTLLFDNNKAKPYINEFVDDLRWGCFVINNRNGYNYIEKIPFKEHNIDRKYHITYGRIADLNVTDVSERLASTGNQLETLSEILNTNYAMQYVFHTDFSLNFLHNISYQLLS